MSYPKTNYSMMERKTDKKSRVVLTTQVFEQLHYHLIVVMLLVYKKTRYHLMYDRHFVATWTMKNLTASQIIYFENSIQLQQPI